MQGRPASARPTPGCSPPTTAEPGVGAMPSAPASRSAACAAATTSACPRPKVRAARRRTGQGSRGHGSPRSSGGCGSARGDPPMPPVPPAPLPPALQRNRASVPRPRRHRPPRPRAAPPALGTGSVRALRSAAAAGAVTSAWPPNEVRGQSLGQRCHTRPGALANLPWGIARGGAAAGRVLSQGGCPQREGCLSLPLLPLPAPFRQTRQVPEGAAAAATGVVRGAGLLQPRQGLSPAGEVLLLRLCHALRSSCQR